MGPLFLVLFQNSDCLAVEGKSNLGLFRTPLFLMFLILPVTKFVGIFPTLGNPLAPTGHPPVSLNSHSLLGGSVTSHRLRAQAHRTALTSQMPVTSLSCYLLLTDGL